MTTEEGNDVVVARHLEDLANTAKSFTLSALANISISGGETYTLPTASATQKGGVKIGNGLAMDGETLNVTLSSGSSDSSAGVSVLSTVPATVDGGFWYDAETNALCVRQGNYAYQFANIGRIYVGDAQGALCAYLPLDTFVTEDAFDNTWTTYGSPIIQDGAMYLDGSSYLYNETIADSIGSQSWTVDFWHKVTQSSFDSCFFSVGAVNNDTGTDGYLHLLMKQYSMYFYNSVVPRENIDISPNLAPDDYVHIAVTYDGSTLRTFLNGVLMITAEASLTLKSRLGIGAAVVNNWGVVGYIDRVRIYNGIARWTGNFTPPTAEDYT